jgi:hypothetical protein
MMAYFSLAHLPKILWRDDLNVNYCPPYYRTCNILQ